jgi:acylphosphatase
MSSCIHAFFSGNVQGVGFRYTAQALAKRYAITGWVANLSDGRVELEIEGNLDDLNDFIKSLQEEFSGYIKNVNLEQLSYRGHYHDFSIKFY